MIPYLTIKDLMRDFLIKLDDCQQGELLKPNERKQFQDQLDRILMHWFMGENQEERAVRLLGEAREELLQVRELMRPDGNVHDSLRKLIDAQTKLINAFLEMSEDAI